MALIQQRNKNNEDRNSLIGAREWIGGRYYWIKNTHLSQLEIVMDGQMPKRVNRGNLATWPAMQPNGGTRKTRTEAVNMQTK